MTNCDSQLLLPLHGDCLPACRQTIADIPRRKLSRQALAVLGLVRCQPGLTSRAYGQLSRLDRYQVARRLPDLERAGLVHRGTNTTASGEARWWPDFPPPSPVVTCPHCGREV